MQETVNDTTEKRSALAVTSLALALLAGLCLVTFKALADSAHDEMVYYILLGGGLLSFFIASIGVVTGSIALYRRRIQVGWVGLVGLMANILSLMFSVYLILVACFVYLFKDLFLIGFHQPRHARTEQRQPATVHADQISRAAV